MSWRLAKSLVILRDQINRKWPERSKVDDGTIGDTAHAQRKSEHNPDENGVVRAMDITNDPAHGLVSESVANALRLTHDPRVLYIISNKKIASEQDDWKWRPYNGANPHDHHFHISVVADEGDYDSTRAWALDGAPVITAPTWVAPAMPLLRFGMQGLSVRVLERCLARQETGNFNIVLETAVKNFQTGHGLVSDGVVGSYTWESIMRPPA